MEVLQGLDLKRNKIDLVSVEMHGYDKNTQRKGQLIFNIMKKNKYKKIYGNYPDNIIFKKYKK